MIASNPAPLTMVKIALLAGLLSSCQSNTRAALPLSEHEQAQQRWQQQTLSTYRFQVRQQCYCPPEALKPVVVTVINGQTDSTQPSVNPEINKTIDQWFAFIADKQRNHWHRVDVRYHPTLGYPQRIQLDYSPRMADDEQQYWIQDLAPLTQ